jgi:hypothetical protein
MRVINGIFGRSFTMIPRSHAVELVKLASPPYNVGAWLN